MPINPPKSRVEEGEVPREEGREAPVAQRQGRAALSPAACLGLGPFLPPFLVLVLVLVFIIFFLEKGKLRRGAACAGGREGGREGGGGGGGGGRRVLAAAAVGGVVEITHG